MRRGEIWWAQLAEPRGSEPGYERPVILVQSDAFTRSSLQTALVVAVSSNLNLADAPGNVFLPKDATGLPRDSVANVSAIVTVDKRFLTRRLGALPAAFVREIEAGLRTVLALD